MKRWGRENQKVTDILIFDTSLAYQLVSLFNTVSVIISLKNIQA